MTPASKISLQYKHTAHRSQPTREVTNITAHKDRSLGSRPCKCRDVSRSMPRNIQHINTSITKVVMCLILTNLEIVAEGWFNHISSFEVSFMEGGRRIGGPPGLEGLVKPRTNKDVRGGVELGQVPGVVVVPMAEYQSFDLVRIHAAVSEDVEDVSSNIQTGNTLSDNCADYTALSVPIFGFQAFLN